MAYKIKELAKISGVTVRALHYYDEIGLLKPSAKGLNNYRYYEEPQLLKLQQIMFFKELGFSLNDVQKLLSQNDFDSIGALNAHRKNLENEIERKNNLIITVDQTIEHLKGKQLMKNEELYHGFDSARQKEYEEYLVQSRGLAAEELLMQSKKQTAKWDKDEWDNVKNEGDEIHRALAEAMNNGFEPDSTEVQAIIERHYKMTERFYDVSKEVYIGLTQLYAEHPDFKKFFDVYHPNMIEFIGVAMRYYASKNLI